MTDLITLSSDNTTLIIACEVGQRPHIVYWGEALQEVHGGVVAELGTRQHAPGSAAEEVPFSLLNEIGSGVLGPPGFAAHRGGIDWASVFATTHAEQTSDNGAQIICEDENTGIKVAHMISLSTDTDVLTIETEITNTGASPLCIDWCAAAVLPVDQRMQRILGFTGRWAGEFRIEDVPIFTGSYVRENKSGRTSHDCFPGLIVASPTTSEQHGACYGFHFGWSGNARLRIDRLSDGRTFFQAGENFFPGELMLQSGETYRTPPLYAAYSDVGLSALSQKFQEHVRRHILDGRAARKPRPIHYNTWEAVYFDHDTDKLKALADAAAEVGAERFILDDGWFGARRDDAAGLGDWHVSADVYPDGLMPLIEHVTALGMEFGLWFEPEMVNPNSDLYRQHPDWVLQVDGVPQIASRNQYVLDLTRPDVFEYLFAKMSAILSTHAIAYIKWDMNRDVHHPGREGRPVVSAQTRAVYDLIDRIRLAFPDLEIESCSSGGARADYGVLKRADRIWTSDSNDALDRQIIQRGASHFFPFEVTGAHVGPANCHITGRKLSMDLRVATAFFGHMGMELNLLEEDPADLTILKVGLALHKQHRALLHSGDFYRLETPAYANAIGVVSKDKTEALYSLCNLTGHGETLPGRLFFAGLDPAKSYRLKIIWPNPPRSVSQPSVLQALDLGGDGTVLSGDVLMKAGIQLPLMYPATCILYYLTS